MFQLGLQVTIELAGWRLIEMAEWLQVDIEIFWKPVAKYVLMLWFSLSIELMRC